MNIFYRIVVYSFIIYPIIMFLLGYESVEDYFNFS